MIQNVNRAGGQKKQARRRFSDIHYTAAVGCGLHFKQRYSDIHPCECISLLDKGSKLLLHLLLFQNLSNYLRSKYDRNAPFLPLLHNPCLPHT